MDGRAASGIPARGSRPPPVPNPVAVGHDRHASQRTTRTRWTDIDLDKATISINRGLVAIGYELHESRGETDNSRRPVDLDPTTVAVLRGWRTLQAAEYDAVGIHDPGWVFADTEGRPIHPACHLPGLRADRSPRRRACDSPARLTPHPRNVADQRWGPRQGGQRAARPRQYRSPSGPISTSSPACSATPSKPFRPSSQLFHRAPAPAAPAGGTSERTPPRPGRTQPQRRRPTQLTWAFTRHLVAGARERR
jgi:hypothetical protein